MEHLAEIDDPEGASMPPSAVEVTDQMFRVADRTRQRHASE